MDRGAHLVHLSVEHILSLAFWWAPYETTACPCRTLWREWTLRRPTF